MPPVVAAAAIAGGAAIVGGVLQSRATNKATTAATKSTNEALTYTKEQEALAKADYERRLNDYYASRDALLTRYGVSAPGLSRPAPAPPPGGAVPRAAPGVPGGVSSTRPVATSPYAPTADTLQASQAGTNWNDWERYGLRQA